LKTRLDLIPNRFKIPNHFVQTMQIRPATIADAQRIGQIHVETWRAAYRDQVPDAVLAALDVSWRTIFWEKRLATAQHEIWVAESGKEIIGFCDLVPSRDPDSNPEETGEIAAAYVQPDFWRKGVGRTLCRRVLEQARLQNHISVTLWVLTSNIAAQNFYEALGFRPDGTTKIEKGLQNHEFHEARYEISL